MHIDLVPQRRDDALFVVKAGDALTINGEAFDFSSLPDGASIPSGHTPSEWIVGPVDKVDGTLRLTLILPYAAGAPPERAWPLPIINPPDGPIVFPGDDDVDA